MMRLKLQNIGVSWNKTLSARRDHALSLALKLSFRAQRSTTHSRCMLIMEGREKEINACLENLQSCFTEQVRMRICLINFDPNLQQGKVSCRHASP